MTPAAIRAKIARARREMDQHEATAEAQEAEIQAVRGKIRKVLGCKEGEEKKALAALQKRIKENQARVEKLLQEAEEIRE